MKKKVIFISLASVLATTAITLSCIVLQKNPIADQTKGAGDDYTLTIKGGDLTLETEGSEANGTANLVTDSTKEAAIHNTVTFTYFYAPYYQSGDDKYTCLTQSLGYLYNNYESPIGTMKSCFVKGVGNVMVSWGWDDGEGHIKYYDSANLNINGDGYTTGFNGYSPNYIKIEALSYNTPNISEIVITYDKSCSLAPSPFITKDGLLYQYYGADGLKCLGFSGDSFADVTIASAINGRTVKAIEEYAFDYDTIIESVYIPNTIEEIRMCAFDRCTNLTTCTFEMGGTAPLSLGQSDFRDTGIGGTFTIPNRINISGGGVNQYGLSDMHHVTEFRIEGDPTDTEFRCQDGVFYSNYGKTLLVYPKAATATSYTVPETCTAVRDYVGIKNNNIQRIDFASKTTMNIQSGGVQGSSITEINFDPDVELRLYWYPISSVPSLRRLILPAKTTCSSMVFNAMGTDSEHPTDVFVCTDDISSWKVSESGDGPWYRAKASYCHVYLLSQDAALGDLPDHIDGSWHYVEGVPTVW